MVPGAGLTEEAGAEAMDGPATTRTKAAVLT